MGECTYRSFAELAGSQESLDLGKRGEEKLALAGVKTSRDLTRLREELLREFRCPRCGGCGACDPGCEG